MAMRRLLSEYDDEDCYTWDDDAEYLKRHSNSRRRVTILVGAVGAILVLIALLLVLLLPGSSNALDPPDPDTPLPPSNVSMGVFQNAVVTANGYLCAPIGRDIMLKGGNAVDAAIATLLCEGAMNIQSMGIGGGFLMTIYLKEQRKAVVLNARETAPAAAHKDMYHGDSNLSQRGGLSVAIPGELRGYQAAFDKYGSRNITWSELFEPTIEICENGFQVSPYLAGILNKNEGSILKNPGLSEFLIDPKTGHVLREGDMLKQVKLAQTLKLVGQSKERSDVIYNGTLTEVLVKDIKDAGGIITKEDLNNYEPVWQEPVTSFIADYVMYSVPLPGSGVIVAFILNILNRMLSANDEIIKTHRIIEAMKFGYGRRTELGDFSDPSYVPDVAAVADLVKNLTSPDYAASIRDLISDKETHSDPAYYGAVFAQPDDHGTAHVNILAPNGDAVSVTSTVNLILGSQLVSSTGIILNDEMDDFSSPNITNGFDLPPSPANFIFPGKRPLSSMCPAIFVDAEGEVALVTGAAGGSKITTATVLIAIHSLIYGKTIKEAIDQARFHHQLFPMSVDYEYGVTSDVVAGLKDIGHAVTRSMLAGSSVTGIRRQGNNVTGCYDFRRGGSADGF